MSRIGLIGKPQKIVESEQWDSKRSSHCKSEYGKLQVIAEFKNKDYAINSNVSDKRIDFIASKDNQATKIQVKTRFSKFHKDSYFWFDFPTDKMVYSKDMYYIFVMLTFCHGEKAKSYLNYLVVPSLDLRQLVPEKEIASKERIFIYPPGEERKKWRYKNKGKEIDFTNYYNAFEIIFGR